MERSISVSIWIKKLIIFSTKISVLGNFSTGPTTDQSPNDTKTSNEINVVKKSHVTEIQISNLKYVNIKNIKIF